MLFDGIALFSGVEDGTLDLLRGVEGCVLFDGTALFSGVEDGFRECCFFFEDPRSDIFAVQYCVAFGGGCLLVDGDVQVKVCPGTDSSCDRTEE